MKEDCKPLEEYCWFIDRVNELKAVMGLDKAVSKAIDEMPDDFIIAPLIKPEKAKVFMMLRTEYDQKAHDKALYDDGKAEGLAQGKVEGEQNRATKTALIMLQEGLNPVLIRKCTGLSSEQITKLMKGSGQSE